MRTKKPSCVSYQVQVEFFILQKARNEILHYQNYYQHDVDHFQHNSLQVLGWLDHRIDTQMILATTQLKCTQSMEEPEVLAAFLEHSPYARPHAEARETAKFSTGLRVEGDQQVSKPHNEIKRPPTEWKKYLQTVYLIKG